MKQAVPWLIAIGCLGLAVGLLLRGDARTTAPAARSERAASLAEPGLAAEQDGVVVYRFEDEAEIREFATLWQDRQNVLVRLSLLQGYWNDEQARVTEFDEQLTGQYGMDPEGNYNLDTERLELVRLVMPEEGGREQEVADADEVESEIVYTFDREEAVAAFRTLWQQRRAAAVRMSVLEGYWTNEQAVLAEANGLLAGTYHVDVAKNYVLNNEARVLIERPSPPSAEP